MSVTIVAHTRWEPHVRGIDGENRKHSFKFN
jgi:hypothetical protein